MKTYSYRELVNRELIPYPKLSLLFFGLFVFAIAAQITNNIVAVPEQIYIIVYFVTLAIWLTSIFGLFFSFLVPLQERLITFQFLKERGYTTELVDDGNMVIVHRAKENDDSSE
jgi:hypothetical protein